MKIVIVGGGCSGVVSAIFAKRSNNEVIILERGDKLLKKLLLTGNGRCNYFNDNQDLVHYHSSSQLVDKFITKENLDLVLDFFDSLHIVPKIKNGYYYPYSNQASTIRDAFIDRINELGVNVKCNYLVNNIKKSNNGYIINDEIYCDKLVLATGSFAYPKTGSDGMGYSFLEEFGHNIKPILPSLVQLTSDMKYCKLLDGVRSDVTLSLYIDNEFVREEMGEVQLTGYGISGICTFNLSYYANIGLYNKKNCNIYINFVPFIDGDIEEWFNNRCYITLYKLLCRCLNKKMVDVIFKVCNLSDTVMFNELSDSNKELLFNTLTRFKYHITGNKGFDNSQVCSGGVDLSEIDPKTYKSLINDNLYILGELIDICGDCGGYNLTSCFISGIKSGLDLGDLND